MNILVVEDDPTDLKLFSVVLRMGGHRVLEQTSAEATLENVKAGRPEVILLDLNLPGMDGLALARWLKADPDTRAIRIVAVTAAPELFSREAALTAGCDAFILKPIDTRKLPEAVATRAEGGSL
jgi:two-component system, cell cycle response regulator